LACELDCLLEKINKTVEKKTSDGRTRRARNVGGRRRRRRRRRRTRAESKERDGGRAPTQKRKTGASVDVPPDPDPCPRTADRLADTQRLTPTAPHTPMTGHSDEPTPVAHATLQSPLPALAWTPRIPTVALCQSERGAR
jgi:hypothetical protein